jgi:hypothetical protein
MKGGHSLLNNYYNGSYVKALIDIYPELLLQKERFSHYTGLQRLNSICLPIFLIHFSDADWTNSMKRREFFDNLATVNHFNPLDAGKWYSISSYDVASAVYIDFFSLVRHQLIIFQGGIWNPSTP